MRKRRIAVTLSAAGLAALAGCASDWAHRESLPDLRPVSTVEGRLQIQLKPCVDRTGYASRDLGREATDALTEKLSAVTEFEIKAGARYVVTCDISAFAEGSALKRWLLPGWGATAGQVAVMVMDSLTGETAAIVRGNATVAAGGFYTLGADQIILSSALDDVVAQLRRLAAGGSREK